MGGPKHPFLELGYFLLKTFFILLPRLHVCKLLSAFFGILQDLRNVDTVFLFEAMNMRKPGFDFLQALRAELDRKLVLSDLLNDVLELEEGIFEALCERREIRVDGDD